MALPDIDAAIRDAADELAWDAHTAAAMHARIGDLRPHAVVRCPNRHLLAKLWAAKSDDHALVWHPPYTLSADAADRQNVAARWRLDDGSARFDARAYFVATDEPTETRFGSGCRCRVMDSTALPAADLTAAAAKGRDTRRTVTVIVGTG